MRTSALELPPVAGSPLTSVPDTVAVSVVTWPAGTESAVSVSVTTVEAPGASGPSVQLPVPAPKVPAGAETGEPRAALSHASDSGIVASAVSPLLVTVSR